MNTDVFNLLLDRLRFEDVSSIYSYSKNITNPTLSKLYKCFCYRDNEDETIKVGISMANNGILRYDPEILITNAHNIDYCIRVLKLSLRSVLWQVYRIIHEYRAEDSSFFINKSHEYQLLPNRFRVNINNMEYLYNVVVHNKVTPKLIFDCLNEWDIAGDNEFSKAYNYFLLSYGMSVHSGIKREIIHLFEEEY